MAACTVNADPSPTARRGPSCSCWVAAADGTTTNNDRIRNGLTWGVLRSNLAAAEAAGRTRAQPSWLGCVLQNDSYGSSLGGTRLEDNTTDPHCDAPPDRELSGIYRNSLAKDLDVPSDGQSCLCGTRFGGGPDSDSVDEHRRDRIEPSARPVLHTIHNWRTGCDQPAQEGRLGI